MTAGVEWCPRRIEDGRGPGSPFKLPESGDVYVLPEHSKFYFQHLSVDQRKRFVDLYNDKTLKLAFPGHFYVRPFFMVPK